MWNRIAIPTSTGFGGRFGGVGFGRREGLTNFFLPLGAGSEPGCWAVCALPLAASHTQVSCGCCFCWKDSIAREEERESSQWWAPSLLARARWALPRPLPAQWAGCPVLLHVGKRPDPNVMLSVKPVPLLEQSWSYVGMVRITQSPDIHARAQVCRVAFRPSCSWLQDWRQLWEWGELAALLAAHGRASSSVWCMSWEPAPVQ